MTELSKHSVLIVQPQLMHYRVPVYSALSKRLVVFVAATDGDLEARSGAFRYLKVSTAKWLGLKWQRNLLRIVRAHKIDAVWMAADFHYVSSVFLSIYCRLFNIPVILHGQGLYRGGKFILCKMILLWLWTAICRKYVGYGLVSFDSLKKYFGSWDKITYINNRFENSEVCLADNSGNHFGIMYAGRLREGCEIDLLICAVRRLREAHKLDVKLHIVGDGEQSNFISSLCIDLPWIIFHGRVTNDEELSRISRGCSLGVYPGRAGLSVLTYMRLGLAVIVADDIEGHMGPEPAYVKDGFNGVLFSRGDADSLSNKIHSCLISSDLSRLRKNSRETFDRLHSISYGEEMSIVIENCIRHEV